MNQYKKVPYHLHNDISVYRDTRRCVRPMYDKKDGKTQYTLAPMESIKLPLTIEAFPERWVSPFCMNRREPYLLDYYYDLKEKELSKKYNQLGIRIQVYSIMNAINVHTRFMVELVCNEPKKWKRIMVSYHLSEEFNMFPHVVDEMDLEDEDTKWRDMNIETKHSCWLY